MKLTWWAVVVFMVLGMTAFSQEFDNGKLDRYFDALADHDKFMGSVAVSLNGELIYTRSVGFIDVEKGLRADKNSHYRIGSISKTFTAVMVMKAVEKGKISLDQTLDKYYPTVPNAGKITIGHLLQHRSGIYNFTAAEDYLTWCTQYKSRAELLAIIVKGGSDFEPGSKAAYSNSNYVLLSMILEKIYGKPYGVLLKKQITKPLGLKHTVLGGKVDPAKNQCRSYKYESGWTLEQETDMSVPLGAGGIISTPSDLVKFGDALFGGKVVSAESLNLMRTFKDQIGLGLFKIPFYDKTAFGHSGGIDGFTSVFGHFPDEHISYAQTSNGSNTNTNNISIAVLSAIFGKPYEIPDFKVFEVDPEALDQYAGVYSSEQLPIKITVTRENTRLIAQGTGQSSFPLEATAKDQFRFEQAGITMEFHPAEKKMILKQGGGVFTFKRNRSPVTL